MRWGGEHIGGVGWGGALHWVSKASDRFYVFTLPEQVSGSFRFFSLGLYLCGNGMRRRPRCPKSILGRPEKTLLVKEKRKKWVQAHLFLTKDKREWACLGSNKPECANFRVRSRLTNLPDFGEIKRIWSDPNFQLCSTISVEFDRFQDKSAKFRFGQVRFFTLLRILERWTGVGWAADQRMGRGRR
jgi:hypothetical protein